MAVLYQNISQTGRSPTIGAAYARNAGVTSWPFFAIYSFGIERAYFAAFCTGTGAKATLYFRPLSRTMAIVPFVSAPFSAALTAAYPARNASRWSTAEATPGNERWR